LWLKFYEQGSLQDEASLIEAVKLVDVVICAVSAKQTLQQKLLIRVIKHLGSIKVIHSIHIAKIMSFFFFFFNVVELCIKPLQFLVGKVYICMKIEIIGWRLVMTKLPRNTCWAHKVDSVRSIRFLLDTRVRSPTPNHIV
jgi:hypothetical protein